MTQLLFPNADIVSTGYTGGFANIDEIFPSDADFCFAQVNSATPTLRIGFTDPPQPAGGRGLQEFSWSYRIAAIDGNGVIGSNSRPFEVTISLIVNGTFTVQTTTITNFTGGWQTFTTSDLVFFGFGPANEINATTFEAQFSQTASTGNNNGQRAGLAISWAQLEIPDPLSVTYIT